MRLIDADVLSYALYDDSPAHGDAWGFMKRAVAGEVEASICHTTVIEAYNALVWYYHVRPRESVLEKLGAVVESLKVAQTSMRGIAVARSEGIPLGDGFLIATAIDNRLPIVVSNDRHVISAAPKYGLMAENPISVKVQRTMRRQGDSI